MSVSRWVEKLKDRRRRIKLEECVWSRVVLALTSSCWNFSVRLLLHLLHALRGRGMLSHTSHSLFATTTPHATAHRHPETSGIQQPGDGGKLWDGENKGWSSPTTGCPKAKTREREQTGNVLWGFQDFLQPPSSPCLCPTFFKGFHFKCTRWGQFKKNKGYKAAWISYFWQLKAYLKEQCVKHDRSVTT